MVATLSTFGLKRGVRQTLERTIVETAPAWEQEGATTDEVREIIGAGDETFLEHRMLVCMDLPSGSLLVAEVAADAPLRPGKPWWASDSRP